MNLHRSLLLILFWSIFLGNIPLAEGISLSCSNCYVGNCECITDCSSGNVDIFGGNECKGIPELGFSFLSNAIEWEPKEDGTYRVKIFCDNGEVSGCTPILVSSTPGTTTSLPYPPHHPRPKTTTTTTISSTTTSTVVASTSTIKVTSTTSSSTSTTLRKITTSILRCNKNNICEPIRGENYVTCREDCQSGSNDSYCDGVNDGRCDPNCLSWEDPDCRKSKCGDGSCELTLGENYENCPQDCRRPAKCGDGTCNWLERESYIVCPEDCPSGKKDGYCDGIKDGRCDPDCEPNKDPDCGVNYVFLLMKFLPYILGILFLILLGLVFILRGRKKGKKEKSSKVLTLIKKKLREGEDPEILRKSLKDEGFDSNLVDEAEEKLWP